MHITLNLSDINWLSVVAVTILSFPLGAFWHSSILFGKTWKKDSKFRFDMSKKSNFIKLFASAAVLHLITLAGLDMAVGLNATAGSGFHTGLALSFLFTLPAIAATHLFPGRSWRLILIDAGFYLVLFTLAGAIFGIW
ncbi:MAG: DUF1761 domain-containing protein [Bacteroidales bacterium]